MKLKSIEILNVGPLSISFPSPNNVVVRTRIIWEDDNLNTINGSITYSIKGNTSNVKFSDGSLDYIVNHVFNPNTCYASDTVTFIISGTNSSPSSQFAMLVSAQINEQSKSDTITVVII